MKLSLIDGPSCRFGSGVDAAVRFCFGGGQVAPVKKKIFLGKTSGNVRCFSRLIHVQVGLKVVPGFEV